MSIQLNKLVSYLDQYLRVRSFQDYCPNGLQVEGKGSSATKELDDTVAGEDEKRFAQRKARELRATSKKAFKASLGIE